MNSNSDIQLTCRFSLHNNEQISGFCPYPQCNNFRLFCVNCLLDYHCEHAHECKKLNEYPQWSGTFNQINQENINKLESILEMIIVLKQFKDWYETQYNPLIENYQSLNIQKFEQIITNMININKITTIIDQSIKPQFEKLKIYLEYIMNQTEKIDNLISFDEFIQSRLQTKSNLINRSQKNYDEAKSLYWAGKYEDCIYKCDAFQKFSITDVRFSLMKGDSYLELKNYEHAIESYKIAIEMDDTNYYAFGKIGDIMLNTGKLEEALKYYDECTKINNQLQEYYVKKAKIYQKLKKFQQSLECLDKVLLLNPSHIEALQMKTNFWQLINLKKMGSEEFQQNLQSSRAYFKQQFQHQLSLRNQIVNQQFLGQILSEDEINMEFQKGINKQYSATNELEKNPAKTLAICKEIIQKGPQDIYFFKFVILSGINKYQIAYAMKNLGQYSDALNICDVVNKFDPNNKEIESLQEIIYTLIQ